MRKYGGNVVFEGRDELGVIEVVEDGSERALHFGTGAKQSSMSTADPLRLQLTYTQAMASVLLFQPAPQRVLIIGLGGGSLAKFFLQHFPDCRVDAVELREAVVQVAHRYFHLPQTPRLRVVVSEAAEFLAEAPLETYGDYDLVMVDAFVARGIAHSVCALTFFENCALRLARDGLVAVNLWSRDRFGLNDTLETIRDGLDRPVWRLPVPDKDNVIALAGRPFLSRNSRSLGDRALTLGKRYDLPFSNLLKILRKHNPALL